LVYYINHSEYSDIFQPNNSDIGNIQHLMGSISMQSDNGNHSVLESDVDLLIQSSSKKQLSKYISDVLVEN